MTKAERCENLRYRKSTLASMSYADILDGLEEIGELCANVHWWVDNEQDFLINALDDSAEKAFEFRMAFSDIENDCYRLREAIRDWCEWHYEEAEQSFNDTTVALVGNRFRLVGYDGYEKDYFSLAGYESELAETEAGKRLMRMTKKDIISSIGQNMGILIAYIDLQYRYDRLKATMEILEDKNHSLLDTIKSIEKAYDAWAKDAEIYHGWEFDNGRESVKHFNALLETLPPEIWCN